MNEVKHCTLYYRGQAYTLYKWTMSVNHDRANKKMTIRSKQQLIPGNLGELRDWITKGGVAEEVSVACYQSEMDKEPVDLRYTFYDAQCNDFDEAYDTDLRKTLLQFSFQAKDLTFVTGAELQALKDLID